MKIGTKSVLFGAHAFWLHPFFVAWGWKKLYGFPWDPRLWVVFFLHDIGYLGKPNMDGEEGESHPEVGAKIVEKLFGKEWGDLSLLHSRFYCKKHGREKSKLFYADKMAFVLEPWWLYIPRTRLSGELAEYMEKSKQGHYRSSACYKENITAKEWFETTVLYQLTLVYEKEIQAANEKIVEQHGWKIPGVKDEH